MIFSTSLPRFKAFLSPTICSASDRANALLVLMAFLLPVARRSVAAASRSILTDLRDAGWLLRWLGGSTAPAALLTAAQQQLTEAASQRSQGLHVLILDSTYHGQQGRLTENTFSRGNTQPRARHSERRQPQHRRHSCHGFVFALLLTPSGVRIPSWLPFYTESFCATHGRPHASQATLAAQLIEAVVVPRGGRVVVVGDTAFEAKQVRQACARRGWSWVVPLNPERRLAGPTPRRQVRSLSNSLPASDFRPVTFRLDQGELAPLARVSPQRSQSRHVARTYWVHHRIAEVHNVGRVALLFSTTHAPTADGVVPVQKTLISDAVTATAEELLHWYALRWQIELFFKELKSELGVCQYKLGQFRRVVNWVNLGVVAYCYLEWLRWQRQQEASGQEQKVWQSLRSAGLKDQLRRQVQRADVEELLRLATTKDGRGRLKQVLERLRDQPAARAA